MAQRVRFLGDVEPGRTQLGFDLAQDGAMTEREPRLGSPGCRDREQLFPGDGFGSAMKQHAWSLDGRMLRLNDVHLIPFVGC